MPVITVPIGQGRPVERHSALADTMTKAVVEALDV